MTDTLAQVQKDVSRQALMQKKPSTDALNFICSRDGELESLMLAACLTALGIPFSERSAFSVSGDAEPVVMNLLSMASSKPAR